MAGAWTFLFRQAESLANFIGYIVTADQLVREFGQWLHHADHIQDLEGALFTGLDWLLASYHDHRHGAQLSVGRRGDKVGCSWSQSRHANPRLAGEPAVGAGHEPRGLFVTSEDQFDA